MEKKIIKDLYCFQCSLQFDKKTIYDMHLKIMHNYISRSDLFLTEIKNEPGEKELPIQSTNIPITSGEETFVGKFCDLCPRFLTFPKLSMISHAQLWLFFFQN